MVYRCAVAQALWHTGAPSPKRFVSAVGVYPECPDCVGVNFRGYNTVAAILERLDRAARLPYKEHDMAATRVLLVGTDRRRAAALRPTPLTRAVRASPREAFAAKTQFRY